MTAPKPGTRCECVGECDRVQAFRPGAKGHRYPGRCENRHLEPTKFDVPRALAVLDLIPDPGSSGSDAVCQWCAPVFRDPRLAKPKPRDRRIR